MKRDLSSLRQDYAAHRLDEGQVLEDALAQFAAWFDQAQRAGIPEPNAMTLATAGHQGQPSARVVLLKELDTRGFVFYTHYGSRKGKELDANPRAALVFLWLELQRQVRIEGVAERISPRESNRYFASRPRESQLGALVSPQSQPVPDRGYLEDLYGKAERELAGKTIRRPAHWGGYRVVPDRMEFWQGRPGRLHDRLEYVRERQGWTIRRLAP
jgi:pyridoxamine 5'-phosphate oxidase